MSFPTPFSIPFSLISFILSFGVPMTTAHATRTLLDDWRLRLEKLSAAGTSASNWQSYNDIQIHLLTYLIKRYADTPVGAQAALFPLREKVYRDDRAVVVNHFLGIGKVAGIKSSGEAHERIGPILGHLKAIDPQASILEAKGAHRGIFGHAECAHPGLPLAQTEEARIWRSRPRWLRLMIIVWAAVTVEFWALILLLPPSGDRDRSLTPLLFILTAVFLLASLGIALGQLFRPKFQKKRRIRSLDDIRAKLSDPSPLVRRTAARMLAARGTLDDISLIADLLALPPQPGELPGEREELLQAMRVLAEKNVLK